MIDKVRGMFRTTLSKREIMEKQIAELMAKKAKKAAVAALLKSTNDLQNSDLYNSTMRELALINLKLDDVVDEYKRFVAKENAVQRAFERLNGLDKQ